VAGSSVFAAPTPQAGINALRLALMSQKA
jgi:hypothetical protein